LIWLVFPCLIFLAFVTFPPKQSIIPWCPKHTPRIGVSGPSSRITFLQIPKYLLSSGVPGPGEITIAS